MPIMHLTPIYKTNYKIVVCESSSSHKGFYRGGIEVKVSVQETGFESSYFSKLEVVGKMLAALWTVVKRILYLNRSRLLVELGAKEVEKETLKFKQIISKDCVRVQKQ